MEDKNGCAVSVKAVLERHLCCFDADWIRVRSTRMRQYLPLCVQEEMTLLLFLSRPVHSCAFLFSIQKKEKTQKQKVKYPFSTLEDTVSC